MRNSTSVVKLCGCFRHSCFSLSYRHIIASSLAGAVGRNGSHPGDLVQDAQDFVSIFLPANKAEVNTLRKEVNALQVMLSSWRFKFLPS